MPALVWTLLGVHIAIIAFNVAGLVLIPLGAWRGWHWVHRFGWRLAHLTILAVVAIQALAGRACFLTLWQFDLAGGSRAPLVARWVNHLLYWPLPLWFFTALYVTTWLYVAFLWWRVPPDLPWRGRTR